MFANANWNNLNQQPLKFANDLRIFDGLRKANIII